MSVIACDDNQRVLTVDGKIYPHITEVLEDLRLSADFSFVPDLEWYAARGHAVHLGCKLINQGVLNESSVAEEIRGYLGAYRNWLKTSGFIHQFSELPLFSQKHQFVGTLDLVGSLPDRGHVIIDIKTSASIDPAVELQTGAQEILWDDTFAGADPIAARYVLQLKRDSTFRLKDVSHVDKNLFLVALALWRWQQTHKRKPKQEVLS